MEVKPLGSGGSPRGGSLRGGSLRGSPRPDGSGVRNMAILYSRKKSASALEGTSAGPRQTIAETQAGRSWIACYEDGLRSG